MIFSPSGQKYFTAGAGRIANPAYGGIKTGVAKTPV
jgi:hypothetical protein